VEKVHSGHDKTKPRLTIAEHRFAHKKDRVVSTEIYLNLSGNLLITNVNQLFPSPALQSDVAK